MGSQQVRQSDERQADRPLISLAPATADHLLADIDQRLYNVSSIVGDARRVLYDCNNVLAASGARCAELDRAYQQERQHRIDNEKKYAGLFNHHQKAIKDMYALSRECCELQQQLESQQEARDNNSPIVQEKGQSPEVEVARIVGKGPELSQPGRDMTNQGVENERLRTSIREFEQGNSGMRQDYEKGLTNAVGYIDTVTQKVDGAENMRQPTSAGQVPTSIFVRAENDDNSESGSQLQRGRAKRARKTKQTAKKESRDNLAVAT